MTTKRWKDLNHGKLTLASLREHFEVFNRSEGKSPHTVQWYNATLTDFIRFLEKEGIPPTLAAADEMAVRRYILDLQTRKPHGRPISSYSVTSRVIALRAFYHWLFEQKYTKCHILAQLKPPKTEEKIPELVTDEETIRLFAVLNQFTFLGARNRAILALLLDGGLRRSELVELKDADAKLSEGYVKVMGKGRKERLVTIGSNSQRALLHYRHHFRPDPAHPGITNFFLNFKGFPLTPSGLKSMIARLGQRAGVPRLHPHLCRHTYATNFLLGGGPELLLKQNLGHTTLKMVDHYAHVADQKAALASRGYSPLDKMNLRPPRPHNSGSNKTARSGGKPGAKPVAHPRGIAQQKR
ncbi:MAG: tyrosine-type recombinase/integrase [Chloroflexi bacterium]|nr:tyrosine-type recombinase/integrase [Chloroflexota bacterium]